MRSVPETSNCLKTLTFQIMSFQRVLKIISIEITEEKAQGCSSVCDKPSNFKTTKIEDYVLVHFDISEQLV